MHTQQRSIERASCLGILAARAAPSRGDERRRRRRRHLLQAQGDANAGPDSATLRRSWAANGHYQKTSSNRNTTGFARAMIPDSQTYQVHQWPRQKHTCVIPRAPAMQTTPGRYRETHASLFRCVACGQLWPSVCPGKVTVRVGTCWHEPLETSVLSTGPQGHAITRVDVVGCSEQPWE